MFSLTGRLHHKFDMVVKSEKFRKLEFVLVVNYNRPKDDLVKFMATGSNCDVIESIAIGTYMDVNFYIQGNSHTYEDGRVAYFTNLQVISVNYHTIDYTKEDKQSNDLPF